MGWLVVSLVKISVGPEVIMVAGKTALNSKFDTGAILWFVRPKHIMAYENYILLLHF